MTSYEDFLQERKDREAKHAELQRVKESSAVIMGYQQLDEDYQIAQSQILAYKSQLNHCKKDLEEERNRAERQQTRIDGLNSQLRLLNNEVCMFINLHNYFLCTCFRIFS